MPTEEDAAKRIPDPEFDWKPLCDWPADLRGMLDDLRELEAVYVLLRLDGPSNRPYYLAGIDFLRQARIELKTMIAAAVLELHGIGLGENPA